MCVSCSDNLSNGSFFFRSSPLATPTYSSPPSSCEPHHMTPSDGRRSMRREWVNCWGLGGGERRVCNASTQRVCGVAVWLMRAWGVSRRRPRASVGSGGLGFESLRTVVGMEPEGVMSESKTVFTPEQVESHLMSFSECAWCSVARGLHLPSGVGVFQSVFTLLLFERNWRESQVNERYFGSGAGRERGRFIRRFLPVTLSRMSLWFK